MRVLHIFKAYYPDSHGGIEQVIHQLASSSTPLGVSSTVLCVSRTPRPGPLAHNGVQVYQARAIAERASTPLSLDLFTLFRKLAPEHDILHYHFPYPLQDVVHLLLGRRKPAVVTYHSDIVRQKFIKSFYEPLLMRRFLQSVNAVVATSRNYLFTSPTLQRFKDKTTVIPIGIDETEYPEADPDRDTVWEQRYGRNFYLFVGVLRYYKGLDILLEAARQVDHTILIAGAGPYEASLRKKIEEYGLTNVHLLGFISDTDKMSLYRLCRAVVFPSHLRSEAYGVTLLEGIMMGKPLISTQIGTGTSFVNEHNQTGLVISPSDPDALAEAMSTLDDDEKCETFGRNARKRYLELFTAERMAEAYRDLYEQVLGNA